MGEAVKIAMELLYRCRLPANTFSMALATRELRQDWNVAPPA